jgi:hypothetical protein
MRVYLRDMKDDSIEKTTSLTLCQVVERNGVNLDDFTKWEVAKTTNHSPKL